jgi:hypothetical protein
MKKAPSILLQLAFVGMLNGKSYRLSEDGRKALKGRTTSQWFTISAIDCSGDLTLCGNNHDIHEGEKINLINITND